MANFGKSYEHLSVHCLVKMATSNEQHFLYKIWREIVILDTFMNLITYIECYLIYPGWLISF